jgi:membrane dipeptidase
LDGDWIVRITLVHLSRSTLGDSCSPSWLGSDRGLSARGREYVRALNERRIFVDLAHIGRRGFADAVAVADPSQPLIVTHTGVNGVHRGWRNLDDSQLRQIADSGGVVGIIFHSGYLTKTLLGRATSADVAAHIAHVVRVVGEDHAAIGSDFDGLIVPPRDLKSCLAMPRLVQALLNCGIRESAIPKILGGNFLRALRQLRG